MKIPHLNITPFLILGSGIIYEVMYFWGIGIDIRIAPLNKYDYLNNWIEWIYYITGIFIAIIFNLLSSKIEKWQTEDEIVASTSNPTFYKKLRESPIIFINYLSIILFFIFLFLGEIAYFATYIFVVIFAIKIYEYLIIGSPLQNKISQRLTMYTLILLCGIGSIGYANGIRDYHSSYQESNRSILLVNGDKLNILRILENWTLVRGKNEHLYWVSNSTERRITIISEKNQFIGIGCYLKFNFDSVKNIYLPYCDYFYR